MKAKLFKNNFTAQSIIILLLLTIFNLSLKSQSTITLETSIFNDFTLTAFGTGDTINFYSYLNAGKVVILDFFEYESGPCYNYHQLHILNQFYTAHEPNGDNSAMVIQMCPFDDADSVKITVNNGRNWNWLSGIDYSTIIIPDTEFYNVFVKQ